MQLSKFKTLEGLAAALRTVFGFGNFGVRARVYNDADIAISNDTTTALTFNSEHWDTDSIHSTSSNTNRLTANTDGLYSISGHATFETNSTGIRTIYIRYNGTTYLALDNTDADGTGNTRLTITTQYYLNVDDYVELLVYQNSTAEIDILYYGNYSPEFMMTRIA